MIFLKGRRGLLAGPSACLALVLLSGCAIGGDKADDVSGTPRRDLAARPDPAAPAGSTPAAVAGTSVPPAPSTAAAAPSAPAGAGASTPSAQANPNPSEVATSYTVIASLSDSANDNGVGSPAYADLRTIVIEDGGASVRLTVHVGASLPAKGAAGEALGIGVDLYRRAGQTESDYQLFADGGPDGWFAYLHTPRGFVRYPGTFALTADGLSFTIPWSALGGLESGRFSSFADWTKRHATGNAAGNDRAPLVADAAFAR